MNYLLDVLLCSGVVLLQLAGAIIGALLVQLVVYRLTGFSIYNKLVKVLITDQMK